jgi:hypothetical protein
MKKIVIIFLLFSFFILPIKNVIAPIIDDFGDVEKQVVKYIGTNARVEGNDLIIDGGEQYYELEDGSWTTYDKALKYNVGDNYINFSFGKIGGFLINYSYETESKEEVKGVTFNVSINQKGFHYLQIVGDNLTIKNLRYQFPIEAKMNGNQVKYKNFTLDFSQAEREQNINIIKEDNTFILSGDNIKNLDPDITLNYSTMLCGGYTYNNVIINNSATITVCPINVSEVGLNGTIIFNVANFSMKQGCFINGTSSGYQTDTGPCASTFSGGGGYGGAGGEGADGPGGCVYGTVIDAIIPGSGGGSSDTYLGGSGGGHVRINASNIVNISGTIINNGGFGDNPYGGGGSGGSIWIIGKYIFGNATLNVSGGSGLTDGGGGGGGRILISYVYNNSNYITSVFGGLGYVNYGTGNGGNGTVFYQLYPPLAEPPTFVNASINASTIRFGDNVSFTVWFNASITNLSSIIFSSNISGLWINSTNFVSNSLNGSTFLLINNQTRGKLVYYQFFANNTNNIFNNSILYNFSVNNTVPSTPNLVAPSNGAGFGASNIIFNFSSSDVDSDVITYFLFINTTTNPGTLYYSGNNTNFSASLSDNTYFWKVIASDSFLNSSNSSSYNFIISTSDDSAPTITLVNTNASWYNTSALILNYSVTSINTLKNCSLYTNFSGSWSLNNTNSTPVVNNGNYSFNISVADKTYLYNVKCCDSNNNCSFALSNKTFSVDTIYPILNIIQPSGRKTLRSVDVNWSLTELNPNLCFYNVTKVAGIEISNTIIDCLFNTTSFVVGSDSTFTFNFFVNDSASNIAKSSSSFYVDTTTPPTPGGGGNDVTNIIQSTYVNSTCNSNGVCEVENGENILSCYADCRGRNIDEIGVFYILLGLIIVGFFYFVGKPQKVRR